MKANYVRDEENEDQIQQMIYEDAHREDPDGEVDDEFASQFLMDSGEGLESGELLLTNSGEVYILRRYVVDH